GAIVTALARRGDRVIVVDRAGGGSEAAGVRFEAGDLTSAAEGTALWDRLEADAWPPRGVGDGVGGLRAGRVGESEPEGVRFVSELNLGTAWWSCREAARRLPAGGAVVNVGSRSGVEGGVGSAAYSVAKAGVIRLTEVLADDLSERRVRVNAVLPSTIDTPANRGSMSPQPPRRAGPRGYIPCGIA